jgi:hypothetical protein
MSPIESKRPHMKLVHIGGDQRVLKFRLSSGVTQNMTRVYVKMMPMDVIVPDAMSSSVKTGKGPVAPVVGRVNIDMVLAISAAATISGACARGRKNHDRVFTN